MKHASADSLRQLEPLVAQLRLLPGLIERKHGTFYHRSNAFLHFHEDPAGLFADVKLDLRVFERHRVCTRSEQAALLKAVTVTLSSNKVSTRAKP